MLEVEGVSVSFGKVHALRDVTMSVAAGTMHGVIGPNGAGKSTLMDVISGRLIPRTGRVLVEGEDFTKKKLEWRKRNGVSRSFQRTSIFSGMTVRVQFELAAELHADVSILEVAEALDLVPLLDEVAGTIAYGDQRRVDIGLALIGNTKLLLLDEPGAGLSTAETLSLFEHVAVLVKDHGLTAVIVEHDVDAIFASCDAVTVLDLGSVLAEGEPQAVRADPRVITAYLGSAG